MRLIAVIARGIGSHLLWMTISTEGQVENPVDTFEPSTLIKNTIADLELLMEKLEVFSEVIDYVVEKRKHRNRTSDKVDGQHTNRLNVGGVEDQEIKTKYENKRENEVKDTKDFKWLKGTLELSLRDAEKILAEQDPSLSPIVATNLKAAVGFLLEITKELAELKKDGTDEKFVSPLSGKNIDECRELPHIVDSLNIQSDHLLGLANVVNRQ